jgi:hypothetical protein
LEVDEFMRRVPKAKLKIAVNIEGETCDLCIANLGVEKRTAQDIQIILNMHTAHSGL